MNEDFESQKNGIELSLARTLLTQLQKKTMTFEKCQSIAKDILEGMNTTTNPHELLEFLQVISREYPIFETAYGFYKLRINDEEKMQQTKNNLQTVNSL